jgi:hypothetical protein
MAPLALRHMTSKQMNASVKSFSDSSVNFLADSRRMAERLKEGREVLRAGLSQMTGEAHELLNLGDGLMRAASKLSPHGVCMTEDNVKLMMVGDDLRSNKRKSLTASSKSKKKKNNNNNNKMMRSSGPTQVCANMMRMGCFDVLNHMGACFTEANSLSATAQRESVVAVADWLNNTSVATTKAHRPFKQC